MDVTTVLLMPGQGGYRAGALAGVPGAAELLAAVDAVAGEFGHRGITDLLTAAEAPDARELAADDPMGLQLAIYASGLAWARAAGGTAAGGGAGAGTDIGAGADADAVLGHSMGEVAAAVHAGYFTVQDGARIVSHRARALARAATGGGGMLAVGLSERRTRALVAAAEWPGLRVAVVNAPRHTVVSGPEEALGAFATLADVLAPRAVRLPAPFPFHNPLLAAARAEFAAAISDLAQRPATMLLYSPALGAFATDQTDLKAVLAAQLTEPVDFLAALRDLQSHGLQTVVECGRSGLRQLVTAAIPCRVDTAERLAGEAATGGGDLAGGGGAPTAGQLPAAEPRRTADQLPAAGQIPAAEPRPTAAPAAGEVLAVLQEAYATHLGYPIEAMTPDAELEGDLGVGSLKHMEILATLVDRFHLHHVVDDGSFALAATLADLAQLIERANRDRVGAERRADA